MTETDPDAPSWLQEDTPPASASAPPPTPSPVKNSFNEPAAPVPSTVTANTGSVNDASNMTPEEIEKEQLRGVILFMRLLNLGVSIAVIVHSILTFMNLLKIQHAVLAAYATCGGLLICCLETQLKFIRTIIALNFGFLFNAGFRFLYYLLLASVLVSYKNLFGYIVAGCLVATALYNTYVLIQYPAYRKIRDQIALEEDARIDAKMKERVRKEAARQMFGK